MNHSKWTNESNDTSWSTYDNERLKVYDNQREKANLGIGTTQISAMNQKWRDVKWVEMNRFIQSNWETQMSYILRIYQNS